MEEGSVVGGIVAHSGCEGNELDRNQRRGSLQGEMAVCACRRRVMKNDCFPDGADNNVLGQYAQDHKTTTFMSHAPEGIIRLA